MKNILSFLFVVLFLAAGCSKSDRTDDPQTLPRVTTSAVTEYGAERAVLGGSVADADLAALREVGVQFLAKPAQGAPDWSAASVRTAETASSWSIPVEGLTPAETYLVRAFVHTGAKAFFGAEVTFTTDDVVSELEPRVTTADVVDYDAVSALLGGSVADVSPAALSGAGVQYAVWSDAATIDGVDWSRAAELSAEPAQTWSARATGLTGGTRYAVRAYVSMDARRFYAEPQSFTTRTAVQEPLTVVQLRAKHAAGEDVSALCVRGYVALSVHDGDSAQSFDAGTVILYDNTGAAASALTLSGGASAEGIGTAGLVEGDYVEIALTGAERGFYREVVPQYTGIARERVRIIDRGHTVDPVWATPAQLAARTAEYVCSPVRLSRVYAETPGALFSAADNFFTDGQTRFVVYAAAGSTVGRLEQNGATGTLYGICWWSDRVQVIPVKAADVADFTGDDGIDEGEPSIEILNTDYYEFPPQGGTRVVDCRVTAPAGMRLFADTRFVDTDRYAIDIAGSRVRITARANPTGQTEDYSNCYIYLAESKDGQRHVPQTIRVTQLSSVYESCPALIQANGGELASVHEAEVNGYRTVAMKLGSGSYTGHYTSDPTGAAGDHRLVFHAVGWKESKHEAGILYLRVAGGGEASVGSIPLRIDDGATGQAPFVLTAGDESRYEVALTGLQPGSVIEFSTSPAFDYRKDDRTGRALLFGVQIVD